MALHAVVRYLILEAVKIIVDARAAFIPTKGSSPLNPRAKGELPHPAMTPVLRRCLTFKLENFPVEVRSQVVLAKAPLNTPFESADEPPIVGIEEGMPLEPEPVHKDIMAMHIRSEEQADKAYIDSDTRVEKEGREFGHACSILKLQEDYGVEYAKNQSLMTVLEPVLTPEHLDEVARLYRCKGMLDLLIAFRLGAPLDTRNQRWKPSFRLSIKKRNSGPFKVKCQTSRPLTRPDMFWNIGTPSS